LGCASKITCTSNPGWLLHDYAKAISADKLKLHPQSMPVDAGKTAGRIAVFDDCSLLEPEQKIIAANALRVRAEHVMGSELYPPAFKEFFRQMLESSQQAISPACYYGVSEEEVATLRVTYDAIPSASKSLFMQFERESSDVEYEGKDVLLPSNATLKAGGKQPLYLADHKAVQYAAEENRIEAINASYSNGEIGKMGDILFNHPDAIFKFGNNGDLIISYRNPAIYRAMSVSRQVRILDATLNVEALCSLYSIDPSQVLVIKQEDEPNAHENLVIARVRGIGALTRQSTDRQHSTAIHIAVARAASLGEGKVALIAPGSVLDTYSEVLSAHGVLVGKPHSDSRGSNAFIGCSEIYIASSLRKNLGAIVTEFGICYKQLVQPKTKNPKFHSFKDQQQTAEVTQAIGRLRNGRRKGEYLKIFFLGDIDGGVMDAAADNYPGAVRETIDACDMDGYMPLPGEDSRFVLYGSIVEAHNTGAPTTIMSLATAEGALEASSIARVLRQQGNCTLPESKARIIEAHESGADFLPSQQLAAVDPLYYKKHYGAPIGIPVAEPPPDLLADELAVATAEAGYRANQRATEQVLTELLSAGVEPPDDSPWNFGRSTSDPPSE